MIPKELLSTLRRLEIRSALLANQSLSGHYLSSFQGQGLSFQEVRPYQPGDDVRTIDWNVSARMREPFVKVFEEERERHIMLVVDLSESMRFGTRRATKARLAIEVAALIGSSACRNNDSVGLVLRAGPVQRVLLPKRGHKHWMHLLYELLSYSPGAPFGDMGVSPLAISRSAVEQSFSPLAVGMDVHLALETLVRTMRRRAVVFVLSDFVSQRYERPLALAAAKHDVIPVVLSDPRDDTLPNVGLAAFEDLESGERVVVDTADEEVRRHYAAWKEIRDGERKALFSKLGLDAVEIETHASFVQPLRALFARRARRAHR